MIFIAHRCAINIIYSHMVYKMSAMNIIIRKVLPGAHNMKYGLLLLLLQNWLAEEESYEGDSMCSQR